MNFESVMSIQSEGDIYIALSRIRHLIGNRFSNMEKQKILVSSSELLRNVIDHAEAFGEFACSLVYEKTRVGLCVQVSDNGPGIDGIDAILQGKSLGKSHGLGVGLSGVKRLMDRMEVQTSSQGTTVVAVKWSSKTFDEEEKGNWNWFIVPGKI